MNSAQHILGLNSTAINNVFHATNCHRRFSNIGGYYHFP